MLPTRIELYGALAAFCLLFASAWWIGHNRAERRIGAEQCLKATTITQDQAAAESTITVAAHAAQLQKVVSVYDENIRTLAASNADLAQRLHDAHAAARPGPMCPIPRSAGALPSGPGRADTGGPTAGDQREAESLDYCAGKIIELDSIRDAWQKLSKPDAK